MWIIVGISIIIGILAVLSIFGIIIVIAKKKKKEKDICFLHCWHDVENHKAKRLSATPQVFCLEEPFPYAIRGSFLKNYLLQSDIFFYFIDVKEIFTYWQEQKCCRCGKTRNVVRDWKIINDRTLTDYKNMPDKIFW